MARVQLLMYIDPGRADVSVNLRFKDGSYERLTATIDTGAEYSLFPRDLLDKLDYRAGDEGEVEIGQAGVARQAFKATEAYVPIFFEDAAGSQTKVIEIPAWFADTDAKLIGFKGVLDRATLHLDFRQTRTGWIEMDD